MKETFVNWNKKLPTVIAVLSFILIIVVRPSFNIENYDLRRSLSEQYHEHIAVQKKEIHGIDISHDQGKVDWAKVSATDVSFVYNKATDGMTYLDPKFNENMSALSQQSKLLYGAYHFFEAEDDPDKQADNFLKSLLMYPIKLRPMVDVEVSKHQKSEVLKKRLQIFINKIEEKTGCAPIIYSYKSFWEQNIGQNFNKYVFWLADYSHKMEPPKHASNLQIWQYSESGVVDGISGPVDLDVIVNGEQGLQKILCTQKGAH
jgi:lysozyme